MARTLWKSVALAAALTAALASQAAPVQWTVASGGNGHWYDIVYLPTGGGMTWDQAFADAPTRSHLGQAGYMATVTSAGEQAFIAGNFSAEAWLGGNDRAVEGDFVWQNGPEAGQPFSFTNWGSGEPNNCCSDGEDDVVINFVASGLWNDIGLPSFPDYAQPYIIEYGPAASAVPLPGVPALLGLGLIGLAAINRRRRGA
ncbi:MAG: hypothetical protein LCI02_15675 [Proteobacteria bacterium]|nr:hypothetical protein [Pseudomonadota bacterium]